MLSRLSQWLFDSFQLGFIQKHTKLTQTSTSCLPPSGLSDGSHRWITETPCCHQGWCSPWATSSSFSLSIDIWHFSKIKNPLVPNFLSLCYSVIGMLFLHTFSILYTSSSASPSLPPSPIEGFWCRKLVIVLFPALPLRKKRGPGSLKNCD